MELMRYARARNWPVIFGYLLFIGMMAIGYCYNVTFVQLGLVDLGTRVIGLSREAVAGYMAVLAIITCVVSLASGFWLWRRGWGVLLRRKLKLAFAVILVQTLLTAAVFLVETQFAFLVWIVLCSLALGVGVPVTFSMTTDFIPVRDRGYAAAAITAIAYFFAAVFFRDWRIEVFALTLLPVMLPGMLALAVLAFAPLRFVDELATNHRRPDFARGRFLRTEDKQAGYRISRRLVVFVVLMFGIFFIDSLGFLRIIETPFLVETAWLSPDLSPRLAIAVVHVVMAAIAGILYASLHERHLFYWIFGMFALVHLLYTLEAVLPRGIGRSLASPLLYATAVSMYTVLNFALWADFSTPQTISRNAAIGVALSGWTATFISTAVAMRWQSGGMLLAEHLRWVDALALVFFLAMLIVTWLLPRRSVPAARPPRQNTERSLS